LFTFIEIELVFVTNKLKSSFAFIHFEAYPMIEKVDFLIIGAGIAGLTAAIQLQKYGKVLVLVKNELTDANTAWAAGGIACSGPWSEDYEGHIKDTLEAGDGICNEEAVKFIVYHGAERIQDLIDWGLKFDLSESGEFDLGREGGHHVRRVLHTGDLTGRSIHNTLIQKAKELPNIELRTHQTAINLIEIKGECSGAYVLRKQTDEIYTVHSKATILATGGVGKVFLYTSNPDVATGDGIAMAWRIGAEIQDMEFIQFHPTCLYHPFAKNSLISEALRGEGAILKDQRGRRFMEKVHPLKDLAPRDIVSRAIDRVLKETGDEYVFLDISFKDAAYLKKRFPGVYEKCLQFGIDITKDPIPVVPAAHYSCGGVKADVKGQTNVPRLFAIGETACTGLHGANRLASNSLLEGLVCGYECGIYVGQKYGDKGHPLEQLPEWDARGVTDSKEAFVITSNWDEIRQTMQHYASIVRSDTYLLRARKRISMIHDEVTQYYWDFKITSDLIELRNLLTVARLIVESAMARKESRGAHFSLDYPNKADVVRNTIMKRYW
jgi:L-aspartate oxidase